MYTRFPDVSAPALCFVYVTHRKNIFAVIECIQYVRKDIKGRESLDLYTSVHRVYWRECSSTGFCMYILMDTYIFSNLVYTVCIERYYICSNLVWCIIDKEGRVEWCPSENCHLKFSFIFRSLSSQGVPVNTGRT